MNINKARRQVEELQTKVAVARALLITNHHEYKLISEMIDDITAILESLGPKYYVRVPNSSCESYYYKSSHGIDVFTAINGRELQPRAEFTQKQLCKYGFDSGFELVEVGDDDDDQV
ncbi:hypothetical protein FIV11_13215 [Lactiplantibacillus plantarum]|uniref:hypothetical protein n=1 Tax=Lactiplantibacillus plantarum TaxID=1590 RepID=UPI002654FD53|nr:hypothetical protein [Lactiplantibacillus plantarum]MDN7062678.1 hypothetical protein [Lactiplantibacillus plantarum]